MSSSRLLLAFLIALSAGGLSGCYSDEHHAENAPAAGPRYPVGVLFEGADAATMRGVFPAAPGDDVCCWVGPNVIFHVLSDSTATSAQFTLYEPRVGLFATQQQIVSILDARGRVVASRNVGVGATTLVLALPRGSVVHGTATIRLHMARTIVPKEIGLNTDPRTLAIILQSASTR